MKRRCLLRAAPLLALGSALSDQALGASEGFAFALIGDIPYNALEEIALAEILSNLDEDLRFVVHVGDLKRSSSPCSDALFARRHAMLDACPIPLIYLPGDNEWVDCGSAEPASDPIDRLQALRRLFFSRPESIGRIRMPLEQQSAIDPPGPNRAAGLPENLRWMVDQALFVTLDIQGSLDGEAQSLPRAQQQDRREATLRWLREGFALARSSSLPAIVLACHADPLFGRDIPADGKRDGDPHLPYRIALREEVGDFAGQVLFMHGDSHRFTADYPFRPMHNPGWGSPTQRARLHAMQRLECFGSPFSGNWIRVDYVPETTPAFAISPMPVSRAGLLLG